MKMHRKIVVGASVILLSGFATTSSLALTVDEISAKLESSAATLTNCSVVLKRSVKNIGAHGKVLQEFSDGWTIQVDRPNQRAKLIKKGDTQLWDCARKVHARKFKDGVGETKIDTSFEAVIPHPLKYVIHPAYILSRLSDARIVGTGNEVTVVGHPKGGKKARGEARTEIKVDRVKNVIARVRQFNTDGNLIADFKVEGWDRHGDCWMPKKIRSKRFAGRNTLTIWYTLTNVVVNDDALASLSLE